MRNNSAFDCHDFVPSQNRLHCTFGLWCNAQHQYTKLLARPLMIALQVVRTSFPFHLRECMGSNFLPPPPCVHATYRLVTNRPFRHYALLSKYKEMRMRLGWTISYKSLCFVHPCLELVPLFTVIRDRSICQQITNYLCRLSLQCMISRNNLCMMCLS